MKEIKSSETNYNGYVIYGDQFNRNTAIGIVSDNHHRKALNDYVPDFIKKCLIVIEDRRFYEHSGVDYKGICRALLENIKAKKIVQGGSTITQQLARNLAYTNKRTLQKKILESIKAIQIERSYSKEQILSLYFNNIYFGKNLYGIRAASLYYFAKEPYKLTQEEQLALLTLLRGPNLYINNFQLTQRRFQVLNKILLEKNIIPLKKYKKINNYRIGLNNNFLQVFDYKCIPFISKSISDIKKSIESTLYAQLQNDLTAWVDSSRYPVTVICIEKGQVVAIASKYGIAHAFCFPSNVGSTLKPFIYSFLRDNQVQSGQQISTSNSNNLGWKVREASQVNESMSLATALYHSNNNVFVNACLIVGLDNLFTFLSILLQKPKEEFLPSSILGATKSGLTLYELCNCYYNFFCQANKSLVVSESLGILKLIAKDRLNIDNIFLKTGTTNDNKERYAVLGDSDRVFAILRGENPINDISKEGGFINSIKGFASKFLSPKNSYKWSR